MYETKLESGALGHQWHISFHSSMILFLEVAPVRWEGDVSPPLHLGLAARPLAPRLTHPASRGPGLGPHPHPRRSCLDVYQLLQGAFSNKNQHNI